MVTRKRRVITVKKISTVIHKLGAVNVQRTENTPRHSRNYLPWLSTVTSRVVTETVAISGDTVSTTQRTELSWRVLDHQAVIVGTDSTLDLQLQCVISWAAGILLLSNTDWCSFVNQQSCHCLIRATANLLAFDIRSVVFYAVVVFKKHENGLTSNKWCHCIFSQLWIFGDCYVFGFQFLIAFLWWYRN